MSQMGLDSRQDTQQRVGAGRRSLDTASWPPKFTESRPLSPSTSPAARPSFTSGSLVGTSACAGSQDAEHSGNQMAPCKVPEPCPPTALLPSAASVHPPVGGHQGILLIKGQEALGADRARQCRAINSCLRSPHQGNRSPQGHVA